MKASSIWLRYVVTELPHEDAFEIRSHYCETTLGRGEMLVHVRSMSPDPFLRGRIREGVSPRYVSNVLALSSQSFSKPS